MLLTIKVGDQVRERGGSEWLTVAPSYCGSWYVPLLREDGTECETTREFVAEVRTAPAGYCVHCGNASRPRVTLPHGQEICEAHLGEAGMRDVHASGSLVVAGTLVLFAAGTRAKAEATARVLRGGEA